MEMKEIEQHQTLNIQTHFTQKNSPCNGAFSLKPQSHLSKRSTLEQQKDLNTKQIKKTRKKKTARACIHCQRAHLTCDEGRPCQRCEKKGLQNCVDGVRKQAKYLMDISPQDLYPTQKNTSLIQRGTDALSNYNIPNMNKLEYSSMIVPSENDSDMCNLIRIKSPFLTSSFHSQYQSTRSSLPPSPPDPPPISFPQSHFDFSSKAADLEYTSISSLLEGGIHFSLEELTKLSPKVSPKPPPFSLVNSTGTNPIYHSKTDHSGKGVFDTPSSCASEYSPSTDSVIHNLNHADSSFKSPHRINNTPEDVYQNVSFPFPYTQGYHSLIAYLRSRFNSDKLLILAKSMAAYRPSFIATTKTLQEDDLIFMEKCFQRTLLEFNKFILCSGTPTVVWRRTGQIAAVGREFCLLTEWKFDDLITPDDPTKSRFIMELMDDNSIIKYFDVFTRLAFGDSRGVIMTDCTLLKPPGHPGGRKIKTCCTWTVKRDVFDIPMMIIGNFLPILD